MNTKLKLLTAIAALAAMPMTLTACGPQCGPDTVEKDGVCMPKDEFATCGQGTVLREGSCILDSTGCGTGTAISDEGICKPAEQACGAGSIFEDGKCVIDPTEDIECGADTIQDGTTCKPDPTKLCLPGTLPDDMGRCVVATAACGDGTALDAATAKCTLADEACGNNTVLANGACVPQDSACSAGTVYNMDTLTCLPEAVCKMGDVVLAGTCVSPAEALLDAPDFMQAPGFDNPDLDNGMPTQVTLKPKGETTVLAGTIDPPVDEDGDMQPDQDLDFFQVTLTAGQILEFTAQSVGGAKVGLAFTYQAADENDAFQFVRFAPFGQKDGTARRVIVPKDGTYNIIVAPELEFLLSDDLLQGAPEWQYVVTVEEKDWPTGTMAGMNPLTATSITDLDSSVFIMDAYTTPQPLSFAATEFGTGIQVANVSIWKSPTEFVSEDRLEKDGSSFQFLPMGPVYAVVDYTVAIGSTLNYTITPEVPANYIDMGTIPAATDPATPGSLQSNPLVTLAPNEEHYWATAGNPGEFLAIGFEYGSTTDLPVELINGGVAVFNADLDPYDDSFQFREQWIWAYVPTNDPNYIFHITNDSSFSTRSDILVTAESHAVPATDMVAVGETRTNNEPSQLDGSRWRLLSYGFAQDVRLVGELEDNGGSEDLDLRVFDMATQQVVFSSETSGDEEFTADLTAGNYVFAIKTADDEEVSSGHNLTFEAFEPPVSEVEPNDAPAMATAWDLTKAASGTFKAGDVDFWSFSPPADLPAGDVAVFRVTPDAGTGDMPLYQCSVTDSNGMQLANLTGARNECVIYLTGLLMAETYTLSVTTSEATDTNYEMGVDVVTGSLSNGANDMMLMAQDLGMLTYGGTTPAPIYGEVSGDGMNVTSEWYSLNLTANLGAGELLAFSVSDVFNRAPSDIVVDILNAGGSSILAAPFDLTSGAEIVSGLSAGQYFIHVTRTATDSSATGRYRLSVGTAFPAAPLSSAPALAIPDNSSPSVVTDTLTFPATPACTVVSVRVPVDITHTFNADVELYLVSPSGTRVTLMSDDGSGSDDVVGTFEDGAPSIQTTPSDVNAQGNAIGPDSPLSAFAGQNAAGVWTLQASDDAGGDTGTVNSWGLEVLCQ